MQDTARCGHVLDGVPAAAGNVGDGDATCHLKAGHPGSHDDGAGIGWSNEPQAWPLWERFRQPADAAQMIGCPDPLCTENARWRVRGGGPYACHSHAVGEKEQPPYACDRTLGAADGVCGAMTEEPRSSTGFPMWSVCQLRSGHDETLHHDPKTHRYWPREPTTIASEQVFTGPPQPRVSAACGHPIGDGDHVLFLCTPCREADVAAAAAAANDNERDALDPDERAGFPTTLGEAATTKIPWDKVATVAMERLTHAERTQLCAAFGFRERSICGEVIGTLVCELTPGHVSMHRRGGLYWRDPAAPAFVPREAAAPAFVPSPSMIERARELAHELRMDAQCLHVRQEGDILEQTNRVLSRPGPIDDARDRAEAAAMTDRHAGEFDRVEGLWISRLMALLTDTPQPGSAWARQLGRGKGGVA